MGERLENRYPPSFYSKLKKMTNTDTHTYVLTHTNPQIKGEKDSFMSNGASQEMFDGDECC